jgi:hypothetical protein
MLTFNAQVFDEFIEGTASTWYTSAIHNDALGRPGSFAVFASATDVSGTSPAVQVFLDSSNDNQNWYQPSTPVISGLISTTPSVGPLTLSGSAGTHGAFHRFRVKLGGTMPKCRLKLGVSGRW